MSPGSVTECLHFYAASYTLAARTDGGGGVADEGEDIEVLELPYDQALTLIATGQMRDGKTIMLLYWAAIHGRSEAGVPQAVLYPGVPSPPLLWASCRSCRS
jgi:hypothetical protein